jgi:RNA polymerase sigma-70 factor (ECF subfamily)
LNPTEQLLRLLDEEGLRLHRLLARLTLHADAADDLLQELFLKLRQAPRFAASDDPTAYAVRSAINLALDWRRQCKRQPGSAALPPDAAAAFVDPAAALVQREELEQVLAGLSDLPRNQRLALVLRHLEHRDTDEIGKQLGKTPHQVRALCAKGLAALRDRMSEPAQPETSNG